jgi:hypothetical protein
MKQSNRPRQLHSLPSSSKIDWSKYETKYYLHFDERVDIEHVKDKIQDPDWVSSRAFLPSIVSPYSNNAYKNSSTSGTINISI